MPEPDWADLVSFRVEGSALDIAEALREAYQKGRDEMLEAACRTVIGFAEHYPEDVFRPFGKDDADVSRDRVSAQMARHLCKILPNEIRAAAEKEESRE